MGTRAQLHNELLTLAPKAYYHPPTSIKMAYPCFVYDLSKVSTIYADDRSYHNFPAYSLTYISQTLADSKVFEVLDHFQYCRFDRHYVADNLHHYTFELFY